MALRRFRRVVTGRSPDGGSRVIRDALAPADIVRTTHWFTKRFPAGFRTPDEVDANWVPFIPPRGSTTFQYFIIPPETPRTSWSDLDAFYAGIFGGTDVVRGDTQRHPGMHRTGTIDYVVVLEGELTMILSHDEIVLRPFDAVVQRGTEHAWCNRTSAPTLFAAITIGAESSVDEAESPNLNIGALFGLTASETALALELASGASLKEYAANRRIAYTTARTHLVNLRLKLDAQSQKDVVRIVTAALGRVDRKRRNV